MIILNYSHIFLQVKREESYDKYILLLGEE